jgi:hypothetical protein
VPGEGDPLDPNMVVANFGTSVEMTIADTGVILAHAVSTPAYGCHALRLRATCTSRDKLHQ